MSAKPGSPVVEDAELERLTETEMRGALFLAAQAACGDHLTVKGRILLGNAHIQLAEENMKLKQSDSAMREPNDG